VFRPQIAALLEDVDAAHGGVLCVLAPDSHREWDSSSHSQLGRPRYIDVSVAGDIAVSDPAMDVVFTVEVSNPVGLAVLLGSLDGTTSTPAQVLRQRTQVLRRADVQLRRPLGLCWLGRDTLVVADSGHGALRVALYPRSNAKRAVVVPHVVTVQGQAATPVALAALGQRDPSAAARLAVACTAAGSSAILICDLSRDGRSLVQQSVVSHRLLAAPVAIASSPFGLLVCAGGGGGVDGGLLLVSTRDWSVRRLLRTQSAAAAYGDVAVDVVEEEHEAKVVVVEEEEEKEQQQQQQQRQQQADEAAGAAGVESQRTVRVWLTCPAGHRVDCAVVPADTLPEAVELQPELAAGIGKPRCHGGPALLAAVNQPTGLACHNRGVFVVSIGGQQSGAISLLLPCAPLAHL
jgi:hypothetical protein